MAAYEDGWLATERLAGASAGDLAPLEAFLGHFLRCSSPQWPRATLSYLTENDSNANGSNEYCVTP